MGEKYWCGNGVNDPKKTQKTQFSGFYHSHKKPCKMIHQLADLFEQGVNLIKENVNYQDPLFQLAIFTIVLSPTFWNVGGRLEYNYRIMRKIFCGNKYLACYVFAFMVFSISGIRNLSYPF